MAPHCYHFLTHWRVLGSIENAYDILLHPQSYARWWPDVFLDVRLREGADNAADRPVAEIRSQGWLPYTLHWRAHLEGALRPRAIVLGAHGDFVGRGVWALHRDGDVLVEVHGDGGTRVRARLPRVDLLRYEPFVVDTDRTSMP